MKYILVFDLDDCLIMHNGPMNYSRINENTHLSYYLNHLPYDKYIYTNGTYGHADEVLRKMKLSRNFKMIYSRDTVVRMKPDIDAAIDVQDHIRYLSRQSNTQLVFFEDNLENLETAKKLGWKTVWIHPKFRMGEIYPYVDESYPDIISALRVIN